MRSNEGAWWALGGTEAELPPGLAERRRARSSGEELE